MTFGTTQIQDGAITTPKINNGAVTTPKIASGAVTNINVATGIDGSKIVGTVPAANIAGTVTGSVNGTQVTGNINTTDSLSVIVGRFGEVTSPHATTGLITATNGLSAFGPISGPAITFGSYPTQYCPSINPSDFKKTFIYQESTGGPTYLAYCGFTKTADIALFFFGETTPYKTYTAYKQVGNKLVGSGSGSAYYQGYSVSLSSDGTTLAVGEPQDSRGIGATWIFVRSGTTWTQQGDKLVGSGSVGQSHQGWSVSLSSDGWTLAVGGSSDNDGSNGGIGATWIFVRGGTTWTQQGNKLVGSGYVGQQSQQGHSVSLSSDGTTLAVGGPDDGFGSGDNIEIGATWIFVRNSTTWTQQGDKLVGTGYAGSPLQGRSVSLSSDGTTLAVGGTGDNKGIGATWIFVRSGTTWTQQGDKLVGSDPIVQTAYQGWAVSLSSDGSTLGVGATGDNYNINNRSDVDLRQEWYHMDPARR